jgi:hypothetical protein
MRGFRARKGATRAATLAALVLSGCSCAPELPPGAISSEAAQKLILERDDARDALARRERELAGEIEGLRAQLRELRSAPPPGALEPVAADVAPAKVAPVARQIIAVEMSNLAVKPIEVNNSWTRFSWNGLVHNNLDRPIAVNAVVLLQDAFGFDLEEISNRITLQPGEFRTISGIELVDVQVATRVSKVSGRVEQ